MTTHDLFNQPFYNAHGPENNSHSERIYEKQSKRLCKNAHIILQCLIDGQELSGTQLVSYGAKPFGAQNPKRMIEYRKRFNEIKTAGIALNERTVENGCKVWSLPESEKEKAIRLLAKK